MIWGNKKSYILSGYTAIQLNHAVVDFNFFQNEDIRHRSIITGTVTTSKKGDYASFLITDKIWLESNPKNKFSTLKALVGNKITFYLEGETSFSQCYVEEVNPYYFRNLISYDIVTIKLTPTRYIEMANLLTQDSIPILTEDGINIWI